MAPNRQAPAPAPAPAQAHPPPELLDFRCPADDAWYGVVARPEENGRALRVMYLNFSAEFDEKYRADEFESENDLLEFGKRFRRASVQLQDSECVKAAKGMQAVVAHEFGPKDIRFYDAIIESVNSKEHSLDEGKCSCTFVVFWQHGPLVGQRASTGIESICLLQPKDFKIDPTVTNFLDTARKSLEERKSQVTQTSGYYKENSRHYLKNDPVKLGDTSSSTSQPKCAVDYNMKKPHNSSGCLHYDVLHDGASLCHQPRGSPIGSSLKTRRHSPSKLKEKGSFKKADDTRHMPGAWRSSQDMSGDDIDLGSDLLKERTHPKKLYFFHIENLEMDISAFDVMDFIFEKASLTCLAFICPGLLGEFYPRATILVETEDEANKLYEFLHDSSHFITSSVGRPWFTDENWCGSVDGIMSTYEMMSRNRRKGRARKLKLVYKGSEEYEQAKRQQALHAEFHDHVQKNLLPTLMEDERRCMQNQMGKTNQGIS